MTESNPPLAGLGYFVLAALWTVQDDDGWATPVEITERCKHSIETIKRTLEWAERHGMTERRDPDDYFYCDFWGLTGRGLTAVIGTSNYLAQCRGEI